MFKVKEKRVFFEEVKRFDNAFVANDMFGIMGVEDLFHRGQKVCFRNYTVEGLKKRVDMIVVRYSQAGKQMQTVCEDGFTIEQWTEKILT